MVINFNINGGNGGGGTELESIIANIYVTDELVADTATMTNFILAGDGVDFNIWGNSDKPVVAALYAHGGLFEESPAVIPVTLTGNYAEDPDQLFINFTLFETVYYFKVGVGTDENTGTLTFTKKNVLDSSSALNSVAFNVQTTLPTDTASTVAFFFTGVGSTPDIRIFGGTTRNNSVGLYVREGFGQNLTTNFCVNTIGLFGQSDHLYISFICDGYLYYYELVEYGYNEGKLKFDHKEAIENSLITYRANLNVIYVNKHLAGDATDVNIVQTTNAIGTKFYEKGNNSYNFALYLAKGIGEYQAYLTIPATLYIENLVGGAGLLMFYFEKKLYTYTLSQTSTKPVLNFTSAVNLGTNIYDLTDISVARETAIYNEMESASTWSTTDFTYYYKGDGQFILRYPTDGTVINLTSFVWSNQPSRWIFNGEFTDKLGQQYKVEYTLYGDELSSPYFKYTAVNNVDSADVKNIKVLTSAEYSALTDKDSKTLYCIKG